MLEVIISIALTTGACAFLFFVLPFMDAQKAKSTESEEVECGSGG